MSTEQKKAQALSALLDSATFTEAAQKAGISRKTLYSYMRDDKEFAKAYSAVRARLLIERADGIEADRQHARDTIISLMDDENQPGAVRLRAAQYILDEAAACDELADKVASGNEAAQRNPFI